LTYRIPLGSAAISSNNPANEEFGDAPIITYDTLRRRMERLRSLGVKAPADYPPRNLPPTSEWLQSVLSHIETAELLADVFPPISIEIEPPHEVGDVDIRVEGIKTYHLQVKNWIPEHVRGETDSFPLEMLIRSARSQVLEGFAPGNPASAFTKITVHWGRGGVPAFSGMSNTVQNSRGIHVTVVQIDPQILQEMARRKLRKSISVAVSQLVTAGPGVAVPVINLTRYPHDQRALIKETKLFLREDGALSVIGGVLLVTQRPGPKDPQTGLHYPERRLIGLENPNVARERRLDSKEFNPGLAEETAYAEQMIVIDVDPPRQDVLIDGRAIIVDGVLFGFLPEETSVPYAIRPYERSRG